MTSRTPVDCMPSARAWASSYGSRHESGVIHLVSRGRYSSSRMQPASRRSLGELVLLSSRRRAAVHGKGNQASDLGSDLTLPHPRITVLTSTQLADCTAVQCVPQYMATPSAARTTPRQIYGAVNLNLCCHAWAYPVPWSLRPMNDNCRGKSRNIPRSSDQDTQA